MNSSNSYFVPSEKLAKLKGSIAHLEKLGFSTLEAPTKYRLVVDTNIILQELIWLVCNRRDKSVRSGLQEIIDATAVEIFAPPKLIQEVERHIGAVAIKNGVDKAVFNAEWKTYRKRIKFLEPDDELVQELKNGVDPDDADFVALAKQISAFGIISKDPHIGQMGGNQLCFDIIISFRDFARSKAIELHIKVMGSYLSLTALVLLVELVKSIGKGIQKLPDWFKVAAVSAMIIAYAHPTSRKKINGFVGDICESIKDSSPTIIEPIKEAIKEAQKHGEAAAKKQKDIQRMSNNAK